MLDLVGLGEAAGAFTTAFRKMSVAEEEIAEACRRHWDDRKEVWNSFKLLDPGELSMLDDDVYRAHCREILERVVDGKDTRPGTRAEVCAMISRMTLVTRLQRDVELLGLVLTDEIFPGRGLLDGAPREDYEGSLREVEAEFRRKLAKPERVLREDLREPPAFFLLSVRE